MQYPQCLGNDDTNVCFGNRFTDKLLYPWKLQLLKDERVKYSADRAKRFEKKTVILFGHVVDRPQEKVGYDW